MSFREIHALFSVNFPGLLKITNSCLGLSFQYNVSWCLRCWRPPKTGAIVYHGISRVLYCQPPKTGTAYARKSVNQQLCWPLWRDMYERSGIALVERHDSSDMISGRACCDQQYQWLHVAGLVFWRLGKKNGFFQFFHRFFSFFSTAMEKLGKIQKSTY